MKRLFKMMLSVLVTITMLASLCVNVSAAGRDVSNDVTVKSFKVISSATGEEIADGGELWDNQSYQFEWDWSFTATDKPIEEGDFIDIPTNLGTYLKNIELQSIVKKDGTKIANLTYNGSNIHIVFTADAEGLNSLSFTTPEQTAGNVKTAVSDDASHKVTVGSLSKNFTFKKQPPVSPTPATGEPQSPTTWAGATYGGQFSYWTAPSGSDGYTFYDTYYINVKACDEIGLKGDASKMTYSYKNTVVENTYPEDYSLTGLSHINGLLSFYRDDGSWAGIRIGAFSKVDPNPGESYADYKARVTAKGLQWGVYPQEDGRKTLLISVSNSTTKYSDFFGMEPYDYAIKTLKLTEAEAKRFAQTFKDDGNGAVIGVVANCFTTNTKPVGRQVVVNHATRDAEDQNGDPEVTPGQVTYTTVGPLPASPDIQANTVIIENEDYDDSAVKIAGNDFKIEKKDTNGDYQPYGTVTAGTNGWTPTTALVTGDYKVTQTSWATGYDPNYASYKEAQEFSYTEGSDQKVVVVVNRVNRLSVTYNKGDHGDFLDDIHSGLAPGVATPDYAGAKDTAATNDQNVGNPKAQEGYHFIGWKDVVASVVDKNVTYVAQWAENEYHITFNSNGADDTSVEAKNLTAKYDSVITSTTDFPTETLTKAGYVFGGWALVNGSTKAIDATYKMPARDITLYAIWQEADYSIKYDLNDSTDAPATPSTIADKTGLTWDATGLIPTTAPTRVGYDFAGWKFTEEKARTGEMVTATTKYSELASATTMKVLTLQAQWTAKTNTAYKVEHYQQQLDGTYKLKETENLTGTTGATVNGTQKTYTGYSYNAGNSTASGTVAADGSLVLKMYYDIDVPADKVIVLFDLQGAFDSETPEQQVINSGDIPTKPTDPVDSTGNNVFYMWFTDKEMTQPYDFTKGLTTNTTLYAGYFGVGRTGTYKVQYYTQNDDKTYSLKDEEEFTGITYGTKVSANVKTYNGYTFNSKAAGTTLDGYVIVNKELVLKVYYDKKVTVKPTPGPKKNSNLKQNNGSNSTGIKTGDELSIGAFVIMLLGSAFILIKRKALTK